MKPTWIATAIVAVLVLAAGIATYSVDSMGSTTASGSGALTTRSQSLSSSSLGSSWSLFPNGTDSFYLATTVSSSTYTISYFPCSSPDARFPDVGQTIVNHTVVCMSGASMSVGTDGRIDFMNGTVVDLHADMTGSSMASGLYGYDSVVVTNGTRFIFNASGTIATLYPYEGREIFANGTRSAFPPCIYPVSPDPRQSGGGANGTAWFSGASGGIVRFYPNGTCSATNG